MSQTCPVCRVTYSDAISVCPADGSTLLPQAAFADVDATLQPGAMVGEYRVQRRLGSGSFGDVYAGEQPLIGKKVAIKVLHRKMSSDPAMVSRFIAEARAVNRIRHRHIIDVFSFGLLDGRQHYFVMELLDGLTLGELIEREGRIGVAQALPILRGIADALDAAHAAEITHRDLKPDNVFLAIEKDGSYFPKLLDFGVAKLVDDDVAHKTATGVAVGTPLYMSPEQSRGKNVDHRADIYALGVVTHQMLTGRAPFEADSVVDLLFKHAAEPPPPMSSVCPDLPPELDAPVLAMLQKRPKDRPSSAGEPIAALAKVAAALGLDKGNPNQQRSLPATARPAAAAELADTQAAMAMANTQAAVATAQTQVAPAIPATADGAASTAVAAKTNMAAAGQEGTLALPAPSPDATLELGPPAGVEPAGTEMMAVSPTTGTLMGGQAPAGAARTGGRTTAAASVAATSSEPVVATSKPQAGSPRAAWGVAAGAVALAVVGAVVVFRQSGATAPGAEPEAVPAASSAPEPPPPPQQVGVRVNVTPADAEVDVDGRYAGSADRPVVLPYGTQPVVLGFSRSGYESQTRAVVPDRDQFLAPIALKPLPKEAPSATASAVKPVIVAPPKPKINPALERP